MMNDTSEVKTDKQLLSGSLILIGCIIVCGLMFPDTLFELGNSAMNYISEKYGWIYSGGTFAFVVLLFWLAFSKYGAIRLGSDDSRPEFSTFAWTGMLFSAGMGTVMIFWGLAEPVYHYIHPMAGITPETPEAAAFAFRKSFLHQGMQAWSIFTVLGLAMAYLMFRKKQSAMISNILLPFGTGNTNGKLAKVINLICVVAAVSGVATSIGLATLSISSGLNHLMGVPDTFMTKVIMVVGMTVAVIACTMTGLKKGIAGLSNVLAVLILMLLAAVYILGDTSLMLNVLFNTTGDYLNNLFKDALALPTFGDDASWYGSWTLFYYAWAIAWAPFVGPFIARVSKGRTIKEFILGSMLVPPAAIYVWVAGFGTTGLLADIEVIRQAAEYAPIANFLVLEHFPMGSLISIGVVIALFLGLITSLNSSTYILSVITSNGKLNPSKGSMLLWAIVPSALALVLMLSSKNGLGLLQSVSLIFALPLMFVLFTALYSTIKMLRAEFADPLTAVEDAALVKEPESGLDVAVDKLLPAQPQPQV